MISIRVVHRLIVILLLWPSVYISILYPSFLVNVWDSFLFISSWIGNMLYAPIRDARELPFYYWLISPHKDQIVSFGEFYQIKAFDIGVVEAPIMAAKFIAFYTIGFYFSPYTSQGSTNFIEACRRKDLKTLLLAFISMAAKVLTLFSAFIAIHGIIMGLDTTYTLHYRSYSIRDEGFFGERFGLFFYVALVIYFFVNQHRRH